MLIYRRIGGWGFSEDPERDARWPTASQPPIRGRHGFWMVLNLRDWAQRFAYFRGTFYQGDLVLLLESLIRKGDAIVDVGAHQGMITMLAARLTGPAGVVYSFEPNPDGGAFLRLCEHVQSNEFDNIKLFGLGLSDHEGEAALVMSGCPWVSHSGLPEGKCGLAIRLVRGDDVLTDLDPARPAILKIDVEGHEVHVLRGLPRFLDRPESAVICEVNGDFLARAASSPAELFGLMQDRGYQAFEIKIHQTRWRRMLQLIKLDAPISREQYDVIFLKPETSLWHRARPGEVEVGPNDGLSRTPDTAGESLTGSAGRNIDDGVLWNGGSSVPDAPAEFASSIESAGESLPDDRSPE